MNLPTFVTDYLEKKRYKKEYRNALLLYQQVLSKTLEDYNLSDEDKQQLKTFRENYSLLDHDTKLIHAIEVERMTNRISPRKDMNEKTFASFIAIVKYFRLTMADIHFDQDMLDAFNKFRVLDLLNKNILPNYKHNINIVFETGEKVHYSNIRAELRKSKTITTGINYAGVSSSVRIVKGLRARAGSYQIERRKNNIFVTEDIGTFYLTNKNIGFMGRKMQFSIPYTKIHSIDQRSGGLYIFKTGRAIPYIVKMNDYEVPLKISSFFIKR